MNHNGSAMTQVNSFTDILKPIFYLCRIFAVSPYTLNNNSKVVFLKSDCFLLIWQIFIVISYYIANVVQYLPDETDLESVDNFAVFFHLSTELINTTTNALFFHLNRRRFNKILKKVTKINNLLYQNNKINFSRQLKFILTILLGLFSHCFVTIIYHINFYPYFLIFVAIYYLPEISNICMNSIMLLFLYDVHCKLIDLRLMVPHRTVFPNNKKTKCKHIINIFFEITQHCKEINNTFQTILIATMNSCIAGLVICTFYLIFELDYLFLSYFLLINIYYCCMIFIIIFVFSSIQYQEEKLITLINNIRYYSESNSTSEVIFNYLRLQHDRIRFNFANILEMDNSFLFSILGKVMMYTIFLCQFKLTKTNNA